MEQHHAMDAKDFSEDQSADHMSILVDSIDAVKSTKVINKFRYT